MGRKRRKPHRRIPDGEPMNVTTTTGETKLYLEEGDFFRIHYRGREVGSEVYRVVEATTFSVRAKRVVLAFGRLVATGSVYSFSQRDLRGQAVIAEPYVDRDYQPRAQRRKTDRTARCELCIHDSCSCPIDAGGKVVSLNSGRQRYVEAKCAFVPMVWTRTRKCATGA